ncbi:hypothetical protein TNCV_2731411, partial [Trichonephila clavipes]
VLLISVKIVKDGIKEICRTYASLRILRYTKKNYLKTIRVFYNSSAKHFSSFCNHTTPEVMYLPVWLSSVRKGLKPRPSCLFKPATRHRQLRVSDHDYLATAVSSLLQFDLEDILPFEKELFRVRNKEDCRRSYSQYFKISN